MNDQDQTRRIDGPALRTLHALERTLRRHIDDLMQIDCEDAEAAEAIIFAVEAAERAIQKTGVTRRQIDEA